MIKCLKILKRRIVIWLQPPGDGDRLPGGTGEAARGVPCGDVRTVQQGEFGEGNLAQPQSQEERK